MSSRDDLLKMLEERRGEFISGAEAAKELGISGTAVWKAVKKLKEDGYSIEAVTNKGYRLETGSDVLSYENVLRYIDPSLVSTLDIDVFTSIDSTNNVCKSKAAAGTADGYACIAANQTAGRGRRGRSFFSPDGTGLYLSMLLRPHGLSASEAQRFTTMAAVSVCEAIEEVTGKDPGIKWVNDIFINGRKVCGILTEASLDLESSAVDYAVVGIGINLFTPEGGFPEEISSVAGAVFSEDEVSSEDFPDIRSRLAASVISHFRRRYLAACGPSGAGFASHISEYRRRCIVTGREINVIMPGSDPRPAIALDVDDECGLKVRYEDGTEETLRSGEISIRLSQPE